MSEKYTNSNYKNLILHPPKNRKAGGRKKGSLSLTTVLRRLLDKKFNWRDPFTGQFEDKKVIEWLNVALVKKAMNGSERALELIYDRIDGKVLNKIDVEMTESLSVQVIKDKIRKKMEADKARNEAEDAEEVKSNPKDVTTK